MIKHLLIIICLCISCICVAANISTLYQTNIVVNSQSEEARNAAIRSGLIEVLTKLTGDNQIANLPVIQTNLTKADAYVEEYSYVNSAPITLSIRYNKHDINQLVKKTGLAAWGENRPLVLIWLSYAENNHEPILLGNESPHVILNAIKQSSNHYALPVIFPMMDMTDVAQVNQQTINDMNIDVLKEAGKRYSPEALLIGKVNKQNEVMSDWQLILGSEHWNWHFNDANIDAMLASLMKQMNQVLAKHYAVKVSTVSETKLHLQVSRVVGGEDLQSLMQYLQQLNMVKQVNLIQVEDDTVELSVIIRGPLNAFEENAILGQHMILKEMDAKKQKWFYEWIS